MNIKLNMMKAQAPQVGTYQVFKVYNEIENGKSTLVADVIYKGFEWTNFDLKPRKLRLRSLFNSSSIGPKEDFSPQSLHLHYLIIRNLIEIPSPNDASKRLYGVLWDVTKPDNYTELIQEENEIAMDFALQDESNAANIDNELLAMDIDDLMFNEQLLNECKLFGDEGNSNDSKIDMKDI